MRYVIKEETIVSELPICFEVVEDTWLNPVCANSRVLIIDSQNSWAWKGPLKTVWFYLPCSEQGHQVRTLF